MSIRIMTMVWDRFDGTGSELLLALALADHAHDNGRHIYPTIKSLAKKTRQSERTVQRQLQTMVETGWLIKTSDEINTAEVKRGREYCVNPNWLEQIETPCNGVQQPATTDTGDNLPPVPRVTKTPDTGDTAMSPKPSINHHKEVVTREKPSFDLKTGQFSHIPEDKLNLWMKAYPAIEVSQEINKAAAWLVSNPKNIKSDYMRFLNGWLSRAQDRAPSFNARGLNFGQPIHTPRTPSESRMKTANDMLGMFYEQEQQEHINERIIDVQATSVTLTH